MTLKKFVSVYGKSMKINLDKKRVSLHCRRHSSALNQGHLISLEWDFGGERSGGRGRPIVIFSQRDQFPLPCINECSFDNVNNGFIIHSVAIINRHHVLPFRLDSILG